MLGVFHSWPFVFWVNECKSLRSILLVVLKIGDG